MKLEMIKATETYPLSRGSHKRKGGRRAAQHRSPFAGRVQYFCTAPGCHCFRRVKQHVSFIEDKLGSSMPYEFVHRETRCEKGHASEYVYVANKANANRFGKSGSY